MSNLQHILETELSDATFVIVDVETTGLRAGNDRIIEIGMVKLERGRITDIFNSFINPGRKIPPFITSFTGISDEDVEDAPYFEEVADELMNFLGDSVLVGHNLSFDYRFLQSEFSLAGKHSFKPLQLCTLRLAKKLLPELRSRSLKNVAYHFKLHQELAHRALDDAHLTAQVLLKFIEILQRTDFNTVSSAIQLQFAPISGKIKPTVSLSLAESLASIPKSPGVYYFLNKKGTVIYVGKAKSLPLRLRSYFSGSSAGKSKKIVRQAHKIKAESTNTELTALLAEAELIKLIDPRLNVQLKTYRNKYFIKLESNNGFDRLKISKEFLFDGNDYFGLFVSWQKAAEMLDLLNKVFRLRECEDKEFAKGTGCFLAEIDRCTAPCINNDREIYNKEIEDVYEFMFGKNQRALDRLLIKMKHYSENERYEKAGEIKLLIQMILNQIQKSSLLAEPVNKANILIKVAGPQGRYDFILLLEGKVFVKDYFLAENDVFEERIDDFYNGTISRNFTPGEEDLEKMKIILNWIIRNRHSVKIFYLKNYKNKTALMSAVGEMGSSGIYQGARIFEWGEEILDKLMN